MRFMNQTDPQHRDGDLNSFPETQNRQTDTKEMHGLTRRRMNIMQLRLSIATKINSHFYI